ncbi:unnamed protein product [Phytophthora fragariaefolia]|uniref:Unnamed protein product n=1 Tax=Phytophthora fragariaefolia TaxID=1490495 RepID=A0A9W6YBB7_9STRA|nr:unnamed protein product [Phytophthora fragariaefolia]
MCSGSTFDDRPGDSAGSHSGSSSLILPLLGLTNPAQRSSAKPAEAPSGVDHAVPGGQAPERHRMNRQVVVPSVTATNHHNDHPDGPTRCWCRTSTQVVSVAATREDPGSATRTQVVTFDAGDRPATAIPLFAPWDARLVDCLGSLRPKLGR